MCLTFVGIFFLFSLVARWLYLQTFSQSYKVCFLSLFVCVVLLMNCRWTLIFSQSFWFRSRTHFHYNYSGVCIHSRFVIKARRFGPVSVCGCVYACVFCGLQNELESGNSFDRACDAKRFKCLKGVASRYRLMMGICYLIDWFIHSFIHWSLSRSRSRSPQFIQINRDDESRAAKFLVILWQVLSCCLFLFLFYCGSFHLIDWTIEYSTYDVF